MRKSRILVIITFSLLSIFTIACEDWLSIAPENDLIKERFWAKREDAYSALAATYDAFRDAALESFIWGELRGDLVEFTGASFAGYSSIAKADISPTNDKISWTKYYTAINLANTLMHYSAEVVKKDQTFTPRMKEAMDAEALFIRSLSYFYIVRLWKEAPLVTQASISDTSDLFVAKSTEHQITAQIIKDLIIAKGKANTTEFADNPAYFKGRANKYSIMALLADVYLWDQQYQKSIDYCDSLINTGMFGLEDFNTWFRLYNPGNSMKESLFEIQFDDGYESQENPMYNELVTTGGSVLLTLTQNVTRLFDQNDLRFCFPSSPIWKYRGIDWGVPVPRASSQRDANFIYYRYADILMMKAEALTELNSNLTEANSLVRQIIERAGLTYTEVATREELRKVILDERGREFIVEGKRWFDLLRAAKRNNFANKQLIIDIILAGADVKKQAILKTKVYDTMSYYLPIPEHELLYNQNLKQNPFYDR